MMTGTETLIWYLVGCLIMCIGSYIYYTIANKPVKMSKKLIIYRSLKASLTSWRGVILSIVITFAFIMSFFDEWVEEKLNI